MNAAAWAKAGIAQWVTRPEDLRCALSSPPEVRNGLLAETDPALVIGAFVPSEASARARAQARARV
jgi:hypothetical protein